MPSTERCRPRARCLRASAAAGRSWDRAGCSWSGPEDSPDRRVVALVQRLAAPVDVGCVVERGDADPRLYFEVLTPGAFVGHRPVVAVDQHVGLSGPRDIRT